VAQLGRIVAALAQGKSNAYQLMLDMTLKMGRQTATGLDFLRSAS
jgi:hypothetical protein